MSSPPLPATHAPLTRPRISPPNRPLRPLRATTEKTEGNSPVSPTTSPTSSTPSVADDRCVYRATACTNPRARKASGERHKFCQFHLRQTTLSQRAAQCPRRQSKTLLFRDPSRVPAALLRQVPQTKRHDTSVPSTSQVLPRLRSHDVLRRALLLDAQRLPLLAAAAVSLVRPREPSSSPRTHSPCSSLASTTTTRLPSIHLLDASSRREWAHVAPICGLPRSPRPEDYSPRGIIPSLSASFSSSASSSPNFISRCRLSNSTSV